MEAVTAARRYLLDRDPVRGYVADKVFKWRLEEGIEGTGGRAIVITQQAGWASPDPVKTLEYPVLWVDCYADPDRDAETGEIATMNGADKAFAVARVVEPLLHAKRDVVWGAYGDDPGLEIVACARWQEPQLVTAGDQHTSEPKLGDVVYVRTVWALQVAHGAMP